MSYAIIRNRKYKRENLKGIFRHNERKNINYSNENIDKTKSCFNYSIKSPKYSYEKEFDRLKERYNLKGQIKSVSNIACEYIITSDKEFFERIGQNETKRYFETAYQFVSQYKNLGEQYILSANVHLDDETSHLHLVFIPIIHTKDKYGNEIDKIACSEFWKEKDSYRQLQDSFYEYMISHNFDLKRGHLKEETGRNHIETSELKMITNFEETKKLLNDMTFELPAVPSISDIHKLSIKRDEKIIEKIIKPKDNLINELYHNNLLLHQELLRQAKLVEDAEAYQKEKKKLVSYNDELYKQVENLKSEFKEKELDLKFEYQSQIENLEKENSKLHKIIDKFYKIVEKFIDWVCEKFDLGDSKELIRDFEEETRISLDAEKQVQKEDKEKEWNLGR